MLLGTAGEYWFRFSADPRFQKLKANAMTQLGEGDKNQFVPGRELSVNLLKVKPAGTSQDCESRGQKQSNSQQGLSNQDTHWARSPEMQDRTCSQKELCHTGTPRKCGSVCDTEVSQSVSPSLLES